MDTINSTLAHGPETRLPKEFYDDRGRAIIDKIGVEEWFSGYAENREYRTLGIGALTGDIVERMCAVVEGSRLSIDEIGGKDGHTGLGRGGEKSIRFALSGCHDTTLAAVLTSMGAFNGEKWPPYTSHIAIEMFRDKKAAELSSPPSSIPQPPISTTSQQSNKPGWLAGFLGLSSSSPHSTNIPSPSSTPSSPAAPGASSTGIARRPYTSLSPSETSKLSGYYVRLRFNDKIMKVPACQAPGAHHADDDSLCTLETFKRVVDGYTPRNWKRECGMNLNADDNGGLLRDVRPKGQEEWAGAVEEGY